MLKRSASGNGGPSSIESDPPGRPEKRERALTRDEGAHKSDSRSMKGQSETTSCFELLSLVPRRPENGVVAWIGVNHRCDCVQGESRRTRQIDCRVRLGRVTVGLTERPQCNLSPHHLLKGPAMPPNTVTAVQEKRTLLGPSYPRRSLNRKNSPGFGHHVNNVWPVLAQCRAQRWIRPEQRAPRPEERPKISIRAVRRRASGRAPRRKRGPVNDKINHVRQSLEMTGVI